MKQGVLTKQVEGLTGSWHFNTTYRKHNLYVSALAVDLQL